jgi:hypothetical protein
MIHFLKSMASMQASIGKPEGFNYFGTEDYVFDRGVDQTLSVPLTEDERLSLFRSIDCSGHRFMQKQCFHNAQLLALDNPDLQYVEGYAQGNAIMPVHHAWLTLNGKLIDLTWRTDKPNHQGRLSNRILGVIPEGWQYRGITFSADEIRERIVNSGETRAFIGDYTRSFPLFRQERVGWEPIPFKTPVELRDNA